MGCGSGELTRALAADGWDALGIDPAAPPGPTFRPLKLEELDPEPFDAIVAVRSLHHVGDLGGALRRIASMLPLGGPLVIEEFAWDRLDHATATWYCERRRKGTLEECREEWENEHVGLHVYEAMRAELDRRFAEREFAWRPYLHSLLDDGTSEEEELEAIEAGTIQPVGFRYVGTPATRRESGSLSER